MAHLKVTTEKITCKHCGSMRIVKHGSYKGNQWWLCRDCGKTWTDNDAVAGSKLPAECVAYTLSSYYDGQSLNSIRKNLKDQYGIYPSGATVYEWVNKYTQKLVNDTKHLKPTVGDEWVADESYIRVDRRKDGKEYADNPYEKPRKGARRGKWAIFWDIIDADSRFLLASIVTAKRSAEDAHRLMELASKRAGKTPRIVVTDKLRAYIEGVERAYGADTIHRQGSPFDIETNTNLIERFHSSLKSRTKVMRGLRSLESTKFFTDGWLAYYNFIRPHMSLGKTPAQAAGIESPYDSWNDVVGVRKPIIVDVDLDKEHIGTTATRQTAKHKITRKSRIRRRSKTEDCAKVLGSMRC